MQSNDETSVPVTQLSSMCQTKQEATDQTKDVHYTEGSFIFPPFAYHDTRNADRNASKTVPIHSYSNVCPRAMRNHRGNTVHFSMGVYENETSSKTHCYTPYGRMRPYFIPHRTRTKSESSDPSKAHEATASVCGSAPSSTNASSTLMETCEPPSAMMEVSSNAPGSSGSNTARYKNPVVVLKKSRSLENVRVDNSLEGSQHSHEMEFVSSRIQKLKVQE